MVDLFVARLPDECKSRLLAAEARAESSLRKKIRAYFKGKAPEDVTASKHEDALGLIRHFEEYAQAVLDAYAKELIPIKTGLDEYLEELQDCAERFPDYMLPQKFITQDDIDYMIRDPGFTPGWAPSGYWEETFLACWNQLVGKGDLPHTVSRAFDWVFRWAFRRSQDAWAFRKRLKEHLEIGIADWRAEWLERKAKQGPEPAPKRRRRKPPKTNDDPLARVRDLIREMKKERVSQKEMVARLGTMPRPPRVTWRDLPWDKAFYDSKFSSAVKKWISDV